MWQGAEQWWPTLGPGWERAESVAQGTADPVKSTILAQKHCALGWGFFLSVLKHWLGTQHPNRNLLQSGSAVKMWLFKYLWPLAIYIFIPGILHAGLCFRAKRYLRPNLEMCNARRSSYVASPTCHQQESNITASKPHFYTKENPQPPRGTAEKSCF